MDKRVTWAHLVRVRGWFLGDTWCVLGDFNAVICLAERKGVGVGTQVQPFTESPEFIVFIEAMNLEELPKLSRKFT